MVTRGGVSSEGSDKPRSSHATRLRPRRHRNLAPRFSLTDEHCLGVEPLERRQRLEAAQLTLRKAGILRGPLVVMSLWLQSASPASKAPRSSMPRGIAGRRS